MALAKESLLSGLRTHHLPLFRLLLCTIALLAAPEARAAEKASQVFHLGQFDSSSQEFHPELPDHSVRVSANDPAAAHNWYAFQPEQPSVKGEAAPVAAEPRIIAFQIAGAPANDYRLHIALLIEHPGVPVLRVAINGHTGSFFLHPKLVETENDEAVFFPSFSRAELSIDIPGSYLHPGRTRSASLRSRRQTNRKPLT